MERCALPGAALAVPKEDGSLARVKDTYELAANYEQKFPTAFCGRSINRTDCALIRDKLKAPSQGHKKSAPVQRRMRFMQSHLSLRWGAVVFSNCYNLPPFAILLLQLYRFGDTILQI